MSDGKVVSKIVPYLDQGSGVVITRGDVHYVVTEWGIANLHGKSIRERVLQMISIAHPDFRDELLEYAKKCHYVYSDQILPHCIDGRICIYPKKYETTYKLEGGKTLHVRPIKPTDERKLQELYYSLDEKDRYRRFFASLHKFPHKKIQSLINIDYSTKMILVGEYLEKNEKKIIASALLIKERYKDSTAEVAVLIHEKWRKKGIAKFLLNYLVRIAKELNFKYLKGSVLLENKPMLHIVNNSGYPIIFKDYSPGVAEFLVDITESSS